MPPLNCNHLTRKRETGRLKCDTKTAETFQRELRCLHSHAIPSNALFLEKSLSLSLSLHPQLKVATQELLLFCTRRLQFHSSHFCDSSFQLFPPIPPPHPGCCCCLHPWPPFHSANTAHPYLLVGIMGILCYEKWYKNQIQTRTLPQLSLQCSLTSPYPSPTWRVIPKLLKLTEAAALLPNGEVKSSP